MYPIENSYAEETLTYWHWADSIFWTIKYELVCPFTLNIMTLEIELSPALSKLF